MNTPIDDAHISETSSAIQLLERSDITNIKALHELCIKAKENQHYCFDGSAVERITTPAFQLLIALDKQLAAGGGEISVINASESMIASMKLLGLSHYQKKWVKEVVNE